VEGANREKTMEWILTVRHRAYPIRACSCHAFIEEGTEKRVAYGAGEGYGRRAAQTKWPGQGSMLRNHS